MGCLGGHMTLFADAFLIESGNSLHNQDFFFNFRILFFDDRGFFQFCVKCPKLNEKLIINGFFSGMELLSLTLNDIVETDFQKNEFLDVLFRH